MRETTIMVEEDGEVVSMVYSFAYRHQPNDHCNFPSHFPFHSTNLLLTRQSTKEIKQPAFIMI
jgi:hypothetical protein